MKKDEIKVITEKKKLRDATTAAIILLVLACFLLTRYIINSIYISNLEKGNNNSSLEKVLLFPNIPQSYIPYYNLGNGSYQQGDYDEAIYYYQKALSGFSSHPNECNIRINLALSLIQKIDFDNLDTETKVKEAVDILLTARNYLTEEECAHAEDDNGHNEEAEKLKKYIDELLKQLVTSSNTEQNEEESDGSSSSNNNNMDNREQQIQQQLLNQMQDAMKEQNQAQDNYESYNGSSYNPGKNW